MIKKKLIKAIRKCQYVYAYTRFTEHDMLYMKIVKSDLLTDLEMWDTDYWNNFNARIGEDGNLYLG